MAARLAAMGLALAVACACSPGDKPAAPAAQAPSREEWRVECRAVKDDRHQGCYGPGWEAMRPREPGRFHFYQVSVERKQAGDAPHVLFVKRFDIAQVDGKLLQEGGGAQVVRYDAPARAVRFDVGRESIAFPLEPAR